MNKSIRITLLGLGHLIVDLQGLYLIHYMYNFLNFAYIAWFFVIYNLIAFGLQPVLGYVADKHNLYFMYIIVGLLLPAIAINLSTFGVIAIMISTFGNAMYHVGGGVLSINLYPKKALPAGVFVAPGAIGVFLGIKLALIETNYTLLISIVAIIFAIVLYKTFKGKEPENIFDKPIRNLGKLVILIVIIVIIRGFIGMNILYPWKTNIYLAGFLVFGVFLGKIFGGLLGDIYGYKKIGIFGLLFSLPLIILGYYVPLLGIIGAMFFNLTMAITLYYIIYSFGKYKGFAFGLTTLALFISYLPGALGLSFSYDMLYIFVLIIQIILAVYLLDKTIIIFEEEKNVK